MNRSIITIIVFLSISVMLTTGQEEPVDRIGNALEEKIKGLRKEKWENCKSLAMEKAETYIDSIIAYEVTQRQLQTKGVPPRPSRPEWNAVDTIPSLDMDLKPLLIDSL